MILFEPDVDVSQRLLTEAEYQFVSRPTADGVQDADGGEDTTGDASDENMQGGSGNSSDVPPVEL